MMPTMVRVTQAHIDAREDSIVEAALVLFARKGIERTTVQEIAAVKGGVCLSESYANGRT